MHRFFAIHVALPGPISSDLEGALARIASHCGFGAEMSASIQERCFWHLEAPIERVTGWDTPFPHTTEWDYLPSPGRIAEAIARTQEA